MTCPHGGAAPPEAVHQPALFFTASPTGAVSGGSLTVDLRKVNVALSGIASS